MKKRFSIVLLSGLLLSCSEGEKQPLANPTQIDKYFPLKDFVEEQINSLDGQKVGKLSLINGDEQTSEVILDKDAWRKELDIFIQSDINKAANSSSYETIEKDGKLTHRLKEGAKGSIKLIEISYAEGSDRVSSIYFESEEDNMFYESSAEGVLEMNETGALEQYEVSGFQKVWFLEPNKIKVQGEVID
ncbi:hypothetical protein [Echinicola shivajiensis]|uniref:hypothetical protein n=1 Tax=Echinicola shivajiensis TaxID=1035916 RepID=UPI001FE36854|nr:hypothetical protein [Echinicola shivajiensis]